jgi:hypothetical protein
MLDGIGYSLVSTTMIFTSLIQMWLPREKWPAYWRTLWFPPYLPAGEVNL